MGTIASSTCFQKCTYDAPATVLNVSPCCYSALGSDEAIGEQAHLVRPFHLNITVLNKEEVLKLKVGSWFGGVAGKAVSDEQFAKVVAMKLVQKLPEKAYEKAGIQFQLQHLKSESHSNVFVMLVQLTGVNMEELGAKALGLDRRSAVKFKQTFDRLMPALMRMEMSDKAQEVEKSIFEKVRWKAMTKMNDTLAAELAKEPNCLKITLDVPELETDEPPKQSPQIERPDMLGIARSEPFLLHAKILDRKALLEDNLHRKNSPDIVKRVVPKVGDMVPDILFDKLVEKKLEKQIPALLAERAGIIAQCRRLKRRSEERKRTELEKDSIIVEVTIMEYTEFPPFKLLATSKGETFTAAFKELWESLCTLEELGIPGISYKMKEVGNRITSSVRAGVTKKLQEALQERLHAEVRLWQQGPDELTPLHALNTPAAPSFPQTEGSSKENPAGL